MLQTFFLMADTNKGGSNTILFFYGAIMIVFWLFFIRPQSKKAKNQKLFITDIKKGDKIVTIAGIHGTVNKVNDDNTTIQLEVNPGSYIKIEKSALSMEWTKALSKAVVPATT